METYDFLFKLTLKKSVQLKFSDKINYNYFPYLHLCNTNFITHYHTFYNTNGF